MEPMKIIFDNIIFSLQPSGGISVVWFELLKRILNDNEIESLFIDELNKNIFRKDLSISEKNKINDLSLKLPLNIKRYLNPKLAQYKGIFHSSYYRISNDSSIANVTTVHDFTYEYFRKGFARYVHHSQKGHAIRNSKKIICVSYNTKKDLITFFPKIKEEDINVIYNGVDNEYHPLVIKDETYLKQLISFSSGEYILYVGDRSSQYKNFILAVKACNISKQPLVMVGGGQLTFSEIQFLNGTLGINKYKHLHGINNSRLNFIYNHAFCLLYPTLYEGFGIPLLEAQRAGCPVISTNYSSIPEVAGCGAILLDKVTEYQIADVLNQFKRDSLITTNLKLEGLKNSQKFSWDVCYHQTKALYKEVYEKYF